MRPGDAICSECGRELPPWTVTETRCPLHPRAQAYYIGVERKPETRPVLLVEFR